MHLVIFGSTGQTGRLLVTLALQQGHVVTAFARDPTMLESAHGRLQTVRGDVLDPAAVDIAVAGREAVLSALGSSGWRPQPVISQGTRNILDAMERHGVRRIVVLSAAGALREPAGFWIGNLGLGMARLVLPALYEDHRKMLEDLRGRNLDWIAVRAVLLTHRARRGNYRVVVEGIPRWGFRISRADVADFMIRQVRSDVYIRKAPAIAY